MTTITTPAPSGTHHLKTALIAVLATLAATGIALGAWALVETGSDDSATIEPATFASEAAELSVAEEVEMMRVASIGSAPELSVAEEVRMMRAASIGSAPELSVAEEVRMMNDALTGSAG